MHLVVLASGPGRMSAVSASDSVWAHATSSIGADHTHVLKGQTVHFKGTVRPGKGTVVKLQHKVGKHWVTVRTTTVRTSAGHWTLSWRRDEGGKSYLRVRVQGKSMRVGYSLSRWVVVADARSVEGDQGCRVVLVENTVRVRVHGELDQVGTALEHRQERRVRCVASGGDPHH